LRIADENTRPLLEFFDSPFDFFVEQCHRLRHAVDPSFEPLGYDVEVAAGLLEKMAKIGIGHCGEFGGAAPLVNAICDTAALIAYRNRRDPASANADDAGLGGADGSPACRLERDRRIYTPRHCHARSS
jgi:hypothetical protein